MQVKRIYKLKEGCELSPAHEMFTKYVYAIDAAKNPLTGVMYVLYDYIDIDTLESVIELLGLQFLTVDDFEDYFELFMDVNEINERLRELECDA